jgi:hypothetical protein
LKGELAALLGPDNAYRVEHYGFLGAPDSRAHTSSIPVSASQVENMVGSLLQQARQKKVSEHADHFFPRGTVRNLPGRVETIDDGLIEWPRKGSYV